MSMQSFIQIRLVRTSKRTTNAPKSTSQNELLIPTTLPISDGGEYKAEVISTEVKTSTIIHTQHENEKDEKQTSTEEINITKSDKITKYNQSTTHKTTNIIEATEEENSLKNIYKQTSKKTSTKVINALTVPMMNSTEETKLITKLNSEKGISVIDKANKLNTFTFENKIKEKNELNNLEPDVNKPTEPKTKKYKTYPLKSHTSIVKTEQKTPLKKNIKYIESYINDLKYLCDLCPVKTTQHIVKTVKLKDSDKKDLIYLCDPCPISQAKKVVNNENSEYTHINNKEVVTANSQNPSIKAGQNALSKDNSFHPTQLQNTPSMENNTWFIHTDTSTPNTKQVTTLNLKTVFITKDKEYSTIETKIDLINTDTIASELNQDNTNKNEENPYTTEVLHTQINDTFNSKQVTNLNIETVFNTEDKEYSTTEKEIDLVNTDTISSEFNQDNTNTNKQNPHTTEVGHMQINNTINEEHLTYIIQSLGINGTIRTKTEDYLGMENGAKSETSSTNINVNNLSLKNTFENSHKETDGKDEVSNTESQNINSSYTDIGATEEDINEKTFKKIEKEMIKENTSTPENSYITEVGHTQINDTFNEENLTYIIKNLGINGTIKTKTENYLEIDNEAKSETYLKSLNINNSSLKNTFDNTDEKTEEESEELNTEREKIYSSNADTSATEIDINKTDGKIPKNNENEVTRGNTSPLENTKKFTTSNFETVFNSEDKEHITKEKDLSTTDEGASNDNQGETNTNGENTFKEINQEIDMGNRSTSDNAIQVTTYSLHSLKTMFKEEEKEQNNEEKEMHSSYLVESTTEIEQYKINTDEKNTFKKSDKEDNENNGKKTTQITTFISTHNLETILDKKGKKTNSKNNDINSFFTEENAGEDTTTSKEKIFSEISKETETLPSKNGKNTSTEKNEINSFYTVETATSGRDEISEENTFRNISQERKEKENFSIPESSTPFTIMHNLKTKFNEMEKESNTKHNIFHSSYPTESSDKVNENKNNTDEKENYETLSSERGEKQSTEKKEMSSSYLGESSIEVKQYKANTQSEPSTEKIEIHSFYTGKSFTKDNENETKTYGEETFNKNDDIISDEKGEKPDTEKKEMHSSYPEDSFTESEQYQGNTDERRIVEEKGNKPSTKKKEINLLNTIETATKVMGEPEGTLQNAIKETSQEGKKQNISLLENTIQTATINSMHNFKTKGTEIIEEPYTQNEKMHSSNAEIIATEVDKYETISNEEETFRNSDQEMEEKYSDMLKLTEEISTFNSMLNTTITVWPTEKNGANTMETSSGQIYENRPKKTTTVATENQTSNDSGNNEESTSDKLESTLHTKNTQTKNIFSAISEDNNKTNTNEKETFKDSGEEVKNEITHTPTDTTQITTLNSIRVTTSKLEDENKLGNGKHLLNQKQLLNIFEGDNTTMLPRKFTENISNYSTDYKQGGTRKFGYITGKEMFNNSSTYIESENVKENQIGNTQKKITVFREENSQNMHTKDLMHNLSQNNNIKTDVSKVITPTDFGVLDENDERTNNSTSITVFGIEKGYKLNQNNSFSNEPLEESNQDINNEKNYTKTETNTEIVDNISRQENDVNILATSEAFGVFKTKNLFNTKHFTHESEIVLDKEDFKNMFEGIKLTSVEKMPTELLEDKTSFQHHTTPTTYQKGATRKYIKIDGKNKLASTNKKMFNEENGTTIVWPTEENYANSEIYPNIASVVSPMQVSSGEQENSEEVKTTIQGFNSKTATSENQASNNSSYESKTTFTILENTLRTKKTQTEKERENINTNMSEENIHVQKNTDTTNKSNENETSAFKEINSIQTEQKELSDETKVNQISGNTAIDQNAEDYLYEKNNEKNIHVGENKENTPEYNENESTAVEENESTKTEDKESTDKTKVNQTNGITATDKHEKDYLYGDNIHVDDNKKTTTKSNENETTAFDKSESNDTEEKEITNKTKINQMHRKTATDKNADDNLYEQNIHVNESKEITTKSNENKTTAFKESESTKTEENELTDDTKVNQKHGKTAIDTDAEDYLSEKNIHVDENKETTTESNKNETIALDENKSGKTEEKEIINKTKVNEMHGKTATDKNAKDYLDEKNMHVGENKETTTKSNENENIKSNENRIANETKGNEMHGKSTTVRNVERNFYEKNTEDDKNKETPIKSNENETTHFDENESTKTEEKGITNETEVNLMQGKTATVKNAEEYLNEKNIHIEENKDITTEFNENETTDFDNSESIKSEEKDITNITEVSLHKKENNTLDFTTLTNIVNTKSALHGKETQTKENENEDNTNNLQRETQAEKTESVLNKKPQTYESNKNQKTRIYKEEAESKSTESVVYKNKAQVNLPITEQQDLSENGDIKEITSENAESPQTENKSQIEKDAENDVTPELKGINTNGDETENTLDTIITTNSINTKSSIHEKETQTEESETETITNSLHKMETQIMDLKLSEETERVLTKEQSQTNETEEKDNGDVKEVTSEEAKSTQTENKTQTEKDTENYITPELKENNTNGDETENTLDSIIATNSDNTTSSIHEKETETEESETETITKSVQNNTNGDETENTLVSIIATNSDNTTSSIHEKETETEESETETITKSAHKMKTQAIDLKFSGETESVLTKEKSQTNESEEKDNGDVKEIPSEGTESTQTENTTQLEKDTENDVTPELKENNTNDDETENTLDSIIETNSVNAKSAIQEKETQTEESEIETITNSVHKMETQVTEFSEDTESVLSKEKFPTNESKEKESTFSNDSDVLKDKEAQTAKDNEQKMTSKYKEEAASKHTEIATSNLEKSHSSSGKVGEKVVFKGTTQIGSENTSMGSESEEEREDSTITELKNTNGGKSTPNKIKSQGEEEVTSNYDHTKAENDNAEMLETTKSQSVQREKQIQNDVDIEENTISQEETAPRGLETLTNMDENPTFNSTEELLSDQIKDYTTQIGSENTSMESKSEEVIENSTISELKNTNDEISAPNKSKSQEEAGQEEFTSHYDHTKADNINAEMLETAFKSSQSVQHEKQPKNNVDIEENTINPGETASRGLETSTNMDENPTTESTEKLINDKTKAIVQINEDKLETTMAEGEIVETESENTEIPQISSKHQSEENAKESEDHTSKSGSAEAIVQINEDKLETTMAEGEIVETESENTEIPQISSKHQSEENAKESEDHTSKSGSAEDKSENQAEEKNEKETNNKVTSENAEDTQHEEETLTKTEKHDEIFSTSEKEKGEPSVLSEEQETSINPENQPQDATEKNINNVETSSTKESSTKIEDVAHKHTQISSHLNLPSTTEIDIGLAGFGSTPCEYCHSARNEAIVTNKKTNTEAKITSEKPSLTEESKIIHPTTKTKENESSENKEKNKIKQNQDNKEEKKDEDTKEENQKEKEKEPELVSTTKIESQTKDMEMEEKEKQHLNEKEEQDREKENTKEQPEKAEELTTGKINTNNDDEKKDKSKETEEVSTSETEAEKEQTINQDHKEVKQDEKEEEKKDKTKEDSVKNEAKETNGIPKTEDKTENDASKSTEEVNEKVETTNTITEESEETGVTQSFELTRNKENELSESGKNGSHKPVVIIINNTGNKLKNLNQTILENILSTSIPDVDLHYIDVNMEENETNQHTVDKNTPLKLSIKYESCKKDDYVLGKHCLCNIQTYLNTLSDKITHKEIIKPKENYCKSYLKFSHGLPLENNIRPVERKRRSLIYLESLKRKGEHIEHDNMADLFENEFRLNISGSNMFCLPGENVKIFCTSPTKNITNNDKGMIWKFHPVSSTKEEELLEKGAYLMLHGVSFKHAGNYTCTKEDEKDDPEKIHWHELEMITFPIYEININIFYKINDTCNLKTGDILHSYLPKIVGPILCSNDNDACSIDLLRPRCLTRSDDNYYNVTINAKIGPEFLNSLPDSCDINCKLMAHQNMVNIIYKNSEVLEGIPVYSKIEPSHTIEFLPNINGKEGSPVIVKPPKIKVFCQGGFGLESKMQSVCVACPPNTFSSDDVAFCKGCPAGQYQPDLGSKSCLSCNSPVDDKMCLRMLYTDTKLFKLYAGIAFGFVVLLIIIMIVWITGPKENEKPKNTYEGSLKHRAASRKKTSDIESGVKAPLLGQSPRKLTPPQLPPVDF